MARALLAILALASALLIVAVALGLERQPGLAALVATQLPASGVDHAVTAVLLNFRSLDTLLEVGVLVLAVLAVLALPAGEAPAAAREPLNPLLAWLLPRLLIVTVLMAAYLYWAGAYRTGGAFQGGTVLAAGGVLLLLGGLLRQPPRHWLWRLLLVLGLVVFMGVGALSALLGPGLLTYPPGWAGQLILFIELTLTLSIAACFVHLVGAAYGEREVGE